MRRARSLLAVVALAAVCAACNGAGGDAWFRSGRSAVDEAAVLEREPQKARNVILFVGDGMGVSTVTAARILEGQLRGEKGEENLLSFERMPHVALVKTYTTNQQVPDSAGTMTALVTGSKTNAYVLSIDDTVSRGDFAAMPGHELETILEQAEDRGLSTGVVTTTTVTHATPAACYAHSPERRWQSDGKLSPKARAADFPDIARQLVEFDRGDGLEVVLGGGRAHFLPRTAVDPERPDLVGVREDGRDLVAEWLARAPNSRYVWNSAGFDAVDPAETDRLMGLFAPSHMKFEHDRPGDVGGEPSLAEMTSKALDILSRNSRGFFLMVEGGRIDHAHHEGNAYRALTDTIAFAEAVQVALDRTDPSDTLIVVTADHSHTLTLGGYPVRGNDVFGKVIVNDPFGDPERELALDAYGQPYTSLGYYNGPGHPGADLSDPDSPFHHPDPADPAPGSQGDRPDLRHIDTGDPDYLQEAAIPLRKETHSGEDVAVYATGPGAALIHGVQEQNYVYHAMVEALGWNGERGSADGDAR